MPNIGDPLDELRKLVKVAKQGEPIKDLEPDEVALRAAKNVIKGKRFIRSDELNSDTVAKWSRPLPQLLCQELPKLWAAGLSGRCAWGDILNWIGQVAVVASDKSVSSPVVAERAASCSRNFRYSSVA